jgi:hypothetical protein
LPEEKPIQAADEESEDLPFWPKNNLQNQFAWKTGLNYCNE